MASRPDAKVAVGGASPRGWHRLQLAAECLQKYAWTYEVPGGKKGFSMSDKPALLKGSLTHAAVGQHYLRMRARQRGEDPEEWCNPQETVELLSKIEGNGQFIDLINRTYEAYAREYRMDEELWRVVGVEELGRTLIQGKYLLTGRRDLIVEDLAGRIWVVDLKTTSRLTAAHKNYYTMSGQLLGYSHMAREEYGERYAGFIVSLIEIGGGKFERYTLPRSPHLEAQFERSVVDIEQSIERLKAEGRPYDQWPKAMSELVCVTRYGSCDFMDQCRFGAGAGKAGNWEWEG